MTDLWLGYAESSGRREVLQALRRVAPGSAVVFASSASELRERFLDEEPGTVGAIVGHSERGVSDLNLAAAIAHDGRASEVVLVARGASGSLRSRARRAQITRVVDATVAPGLAEVLEGAGEPNAPVQPDEKRPEAEEKPEARVEGHALAPGDSAPDPSADVAAEPEMVAEGEGQEASPRPDEVAPILTVTSGRGGVGKTSLVALMAMVAAGWGMDVAVVDLDLSCGNLHTCFGVMRGPDLARIVRDGATTAELMGRASVRCGEHVQLWGPCERPEMAELVMPHVATLLSYLSARHDLVLVDTSTTFTDGIAQAVQSCDRMLVVHDERAGAIASAARISALAVRLGVARTRIVRVADLADPRARGNAFEGRAELGLETARLHRVVDGGVEAEELLLSGKVAELAASRSDVVTCVSVMLAQTLSELGRLPDNEEARKAAQRSLQRRRFALFGRNREAV